MTTALMTTEREILNGGLQILEEYGVPAELVATEPTTRGKMTYRPDATICLKTGQKKRRFDIECKRWLKPGNLGAVVTQLKQGENPGFLMTDQITGPMAQRLRDLGIPFVDMAGNAWLELPPVVIRVEGRKLKEHLDAPPRNRAFQPTGLKVVFALLCYPQLFKAPLREIAELTGVVHGTVGWVMYGLREQGYLIERGKGRGRKRTPRNLTGLLDEWAEEYARTLRPKLVLGRYAPGQKTANKWWNEAGNPKYGTFIGGEPAAALLTDYLQPGEITLYTEKVPGRLIADYGLDRDKEGPIEFRRRFWPFNYEWEHPDLVPPVLIYADLLATDEARCVETAKIIHEQYLAGPLGEY